MGFKANDMIMSLNIGTKDAPEWKKVEPVSMGDLSNGVDNNGGFILNRIVEFDGWLHYVCADGRVWIKPNAGSKWVENTPGIGVDEVTFQGVDEDTQEIEEPHKIFVC